MRTTCAIIAIVLSGACGLDIQGELRGTDDGIGTPDVDGGASPDGNGIDLPSPGADGGAPPKEEVPLDPKAPCGRASTYVDDFEDGVIAPEWSTIPAASVSEVAGQLVVAHAAGAAAALASRFAVDLRDDRLRVKVASFTAGTRVSIAARRDATHELSASIVGSALVFRLIDDAAPDDTSVAYDPKEHRWIQILENAGNVLWQTSPDAKTWTTRRTTATPTFARAVTLILGAGATAGAPAGEARFERLNAGRPRADWCKTSTLVDDFNDGVTGFNWITPVLQQGACTWSESGSEVRFVMNGSGACFCAYRSAAAYDLRSSSVMLHVPVISNYRPQVRFFLRLEDAQSRFAEIGFMGSNELFENASGLANQQTAYGGGTEDYWRLREANGMLLWESSGDGASFVVKRTAPAPFPLDAVRVLFGARTDAAMTASISIGTPGINVP